MSTSNLIFIYNIILIEKVKECFVGKTQFSYTKFRLNLGIFKGQIAIQDLFMVDSNISTEKLVI